MRGRGADVADGVPVSATEEAALLVLMIVAQQRPCHRQVFRRQVAATHSHALHVGHVNPTRTATCYTWVT